MRALATAVAGLLSISTASAATFPISGAFGSEDACAIYTRGGTDALFKSESNGTLVLPDRVIEAGKDCTVTKAVDDGEYTAELSCRFTPDAINETAPPWFAYAGKLPDWEAKRHKKSDIQNLIWYAEGRAGIVLSRCK